MIRRILARLAYIALIVGAALCVRAYVAAPYVIPSASMEPMLQTGDRLIADKLSYTQNVDPVAGDIVIFAKPSDGTRLIKRVIAVAGQTVDIYDGHVYVDGDELSEPYAQGDTYKLESSIAYPYAVPAGCVWVMGDNRENSSDSRVFGAIEVSSIEARAYLRYYPLNRIGIV